MYANTYDLQRRKPSTSNERNLKRAAAVKSRPKSRASTKHSSVESAQNRHWRGGVGGTGPLANLTLENRQSFNNISELF